MTPGDRIDLDERGALISALAAAAVGAFAAVTASLSLAIVAGVLLALSVGFAVDIWRTERHGRG